MSRCAFEMRIIYRPHLLKRLKERKIPETYPKLIIEKPEREYFDVLAKRNIAIKELHFEGEVRNILVAYDIIENGVEIVTIHIISGKEIENKVRAGRWRKYERN